MTTANDAFPSRNPRTVFANALVALQPLMHVTVGDVHAVLRAVPQGLPCESVPQANHLAAAWLAASALLRRQRLPRSFATLIAVVGVGEGYAAAHARTLLDWLGALPDNDDAPG